MRRAISVLSAVFMMFIGGFVFAPAASAAGYGCSGNLIDTYNVYTDSGTKYGEIKLYYSSENGGTNCAATVDTYFSSGVRKSIGVWIGRCPAGTTAGSTCASDQFDEDKGPFYTYAGPASVTGTASRCVKVTGWVANPNVSGLQAFRATNAVHC